MLRTKDAGFFITLRVIGYFRLVRPQKKLAATGIMLPLGGTSAVPGSRQASGTPAGGHVSGHRTGTELVEVSCRARCNRFVFNKMLHTGFLHVRAICTMQDAIQACTRRRGGFDVGRNKGLPLPDSRRKTGSLAPSFLPDSRVHARRGVAWCLRRR